MRAPQIAWKGKVDLLVLSNDTCEITDFKTGEPDPRHSFQIQVYALLWNRDDELNPRHRLADELVLAYTGGNVRIAAPTAAQLEDLERDLVTRRDSARRAVSEDPPEARPSAGNCSFCGVRHLCDKYWTAHTQQALAAQFSDQRYADFELTISARHGPASWDAVVGLSRVAATGKRVLLRTKGDLELRTGDRLRVLDAAVASDNESAQPIVITLGSLSEAYSVA